MKSTSLFIAVMLMVFHTLSGQSSIKNAKSQGTILGVVTMCGSGFPMQYVTVRANGAQQFITETNASGYYEMLVEEGIYNIEFGLLGYDTVIILDTTILVGSMTEINVSMHQSPYPVSNVVATLYAGGTQCDITWELPIGPYEITDDDGEAEDYAIWTMSGGGVAIQFTPVYYPAIALGGSIYVGDGSFPAGGNFLGTNMAVGIIDDDGTDGLPGTILDSTIITVDNYGWVDFYGVFNVDVLDGDFYVAMWQTGDATNSAPVGVDTDLPIINNSYSKLPTSNTWSISPYQDFMIRAYVSGSNQNMANYSIARISDFEPCNNPASGILTPLGTTSATAYSEPINLQPGYYAYAIKAVYNCGESVWAYSNTFSVLLDKQVTFNISLCDGGEQDSAEITLIGKTCPWDIYNGTTDTNGLLILDTIVEGYYDVLVNHIGYSVFELDSIPILNDTTINIELTQKKYPPRNMYVDTTTNIATWDPPLITALPLENFEDTIFPPDGWHETHYPAPFGWYRTDYFNYDDFPVPPGDGYYAIAEAGYYTSPTHPNDRLITPMLDLREVNNYTLFFDSYYTGAFGQSAYVEYSYNNGETWNVIEVMDPVWEWHQEEIDLSEFSGPDSEPIWIAFHSDDNNISASGWAIDNVSITAGPAEVLYYYLFLDSAFIGTVDNDWFSYSFANAIPYGYNATACVSASYECGMSAWNCDSWESTFLFPPKNFHDEYVYNTQEIPLMWNRPSIYGADTLPVGLVSFNIYQDSILMDSILYENQGANEWFSYLADSLSPGNYIFDIVAVYELSAYGLPGEYDESPFVSDTIEVIWGSTLPFFEDWSTGNFDDKWIVDDTIGNWRINTSVGNPEPIAEFYWQPHIDGQYESSITSTYIRVDSLSEGNIFLDFDFRLRDRSNTGNEKLTVDVFDGFLWHEIIEFANNGSTIYIDYHIDISDYVTSNVFRVRFVAHGENIRDIYSWFIDNISIYRECEAPYALTIDVDWHNFENPAIKICWEAPYHIAEWIHWDNGENYTGIGLTDGGTISAAARWNTDQLVDYEGASIIKIRYFVLEGFTSVILKIWEGTYSGTLVYEEDVTANTQANEWNEIILTNPMPINIIDDLLVGYSITHIEGALSAGTDAGPAISGNGDMVSTDGGSTWDPLSGFGLDYNWNIQVFVEEIPFAITPTPINETKTYSSSLSKLVQGPINENPVATPRSGSRSMHGFNIYRMEDGGDYELYDVVDYIYGQNNYCYFDTVPNVNLQNGYYYKVTATWMSDVDNCESAPAMALEIPEDDFVYIFLENIDDISTSGLINIFPNPAKDYLTITSSSPINNIRIINYVGQEVLNSTFNGVTTQKIVTNSYQTGVYIIEVAANAKVFTKKIIINR